MALPAARPPPCTAVHYYGKWRDDGTDQAVGALLNALQEKTGLDPGKKSRGCKRGIVTDAPDCSSP
ncbi:hypothetical protein ACWD1Y_31850 [Streptomyces sp. NPDC002814]|uniref:hypothetical protein n=1 Tax=Streptomyces sp. GESEQ-4 TaxID=2812655 RepID=UPI001B322F19|nr:hypothetical protein [Streptomyces sp. GESEQ-4]